MRAYFQGKCFECGVSGWHPTSLALTKGTNRLLCHKHFDAYLQGIMDRARATWSRRDRELARLADRLSSA